MNTRDNIISTFKHLSEEVGFEQVRISKICTLLHIERKLFYYYFSDKYELLTTIYLDDINRYFNLAVTNKTNWQSNALKLLSSYRQSGKFYHATVLTDHGTWKSVFGEHMEKLFTELFIELSAEITDKIEFYAQFFANGWVGLVFQWIKHYFSPTETKLVDNFNGLINFTQKYIDNW
ncbi:TetR/AcrR family transcriptional regulator C-terminal domain-containing protein [Lentilactobacillus kosonis]|uniref:Transcriptional regulator, TetR family n=1 Tax=Lentilactobacillus kosonis TaxID=2810561 RepID=A0A401FHQ8_9LACO|nr:TetR/AcrR family transcriptional regulator C-terminal domain-containing protein [Lentilactobacillus kosonis]GAY71905.1 transcriptional regulator, TetR family [Lentilactobacillus kosonis]